MKVLVINGSPAGKNSITLQTIYYIKQYFPNVTFDILHAGIQIRKIEKDFSESRKKLEEADLILFCYPVYTFLVPAQLHRFIELIKESGTDLSGRYASQLTTSKHFYDITAHQYIQDNCDDMGLKYIRGLSADMEDLLHEQGQKEALSFFHYVLWSMDQNCFEPARYPVKACVSANTPEAGSIQNCTAGTVTDRFSDFTTDRPPAPGRIVIVTDTDPSLKSGLNYMISTFIDKTKRETVLVNLADFPFDGGCLGCFHCASDGTCIYKDGFDRFLREKIQTADAIVYAFTIKDHSMGYRFKLYDDRQFCNGHRTVTMGKPVGYLVSGNLNTEFNLQTVMEARSQVGGNYLAGIVSDQNDPLPQIRQLALTLEYVIDNQYQPPKNFYGVGGLKIFRDLIYQMQGLMREDHRFYKKHGFYDFPQKHKGKIAAMYLVGAMMKNRIINKKIGNKMTEGMLMPYRKVFRKKDT